MKRARDQRHDHPGQKSHHTRVEDGVAEDEIPRPNCWGKSQIQNHRDREDAQKSGDGHFPARWRIVGGAKPRFEASQWPIDRLTFRQRSCPLFPRFEHWRCIKCISLLLAGKRAQDSVFAGVRTWWWCKHACALDAIMGERCLQEFAQRRLKLGFAARSEEHTSELQSPCNLVCRLLLEKKTPPVLHISVSMLLKLLLMVVALLLLFSPQCFVSIR